MNLGPLLNKPEYEFILNENYVERKNGNKK